MLNLKTRFARKRSAWNKWNVLSTLLQCSSRRSRPGVFCEKVILRNVAKFTGKHLYQRFYFKKVAGLRPSTLPKKRLWHWCFPVSFAKFLGTLFLKETSGGCFWSASIFVSVTFTEVLMKNLARMLIHVRKIKKCSVSFKMLWLICLVTVEKRL